MVGVQPGTGGTSNYNTMGPADLRSISSEFTRNFCLNIWFLTKAWARNKFSKLKMKGGEVSSVVGNWYNRKHHKKKPKQANYNICVYLW